MVRFPDKTSNSSLFRRGTLILAPASKDETHQDTYQTMSSSQTPAQPPHSQQQSERIVVDGYTPCSVLVLNSSREMAKEITHQLTISLPGCSMTYAPSIELAGWILKRRKIDLIVSSPRLPDGGIDRLKQQLSGIESPPDLVVVGKVSTENVTALGDLGYHFASWKRIGRQDDISKRPARSQECERTKRKKMVRKQVKTLGADIRNDLNNPLQEIVAMVFVAQQAGEVAETTHQALDAIDIAAKNMAEYVNALEDRIRTAVVPAVG